MPKEKALIKCLSIIILDSVTKANKKYYPQTLLEECKYVQEQVKTENHINDDLEKSGSDSGVCLNYYKKKNTFFSLQCIRMSGKSINFDDKKKKNANFTKIKKYFR